MQSWQISVSEDSPMIRFGVGQIAAAIREEIGCDPAIVEAQTGERCLCVSIDPSLPRDGYRLRVSAPDGEAQTVQIAGWDARSVLYGCVDFVNLYLAQARLSHTSNSPYYFRPLFSDRPLPPADLLRVPKVRHRGLWSWGLAVYDYRAYLENMARLKLNEVIFWNDYAPVNGRAVVDCAHALGISVLWGYAWGWDTSMKLDTSEEAVEQIVRRYEREYAALGGDGIYFQSFTETSEERLDGKLIAEAVTDFVNRIAGRILHRHPGLRLQFGLHAQSVKNHLEFIRQVDPRVEIIWEDCGDFPYHYIPSHIEAPEETYALTRKLLALRAQGGVGAVIKGMICLNWDQFRHQAGPSLLGCADETTMNARLNQARRIWHYIQAEWMVHGETCREMIACLSQKDVSLYGLVEDGMLEKEIPLPVALFAEILWNPDQRFHKLLRETAERPDVHMA